MLRTIPAAAGATLPCRNGGGDNRADRPGGQPQNTAATPLRYTLRMPTRRLDNFA